MKFIVNPNEPNPFKATHFKFLGRWLNPMTNEKDIPKETNYLFVDRGYRDHTIFKA